MNAIKQNPRAGCEFHGALRTALAIGGLTPIVHSNQGCAIQCYLADKNAGVSFPSGGYNIPATGVIERHVVFGGASRLREQIKNTVKVVGGESYIIINGCESAMVGDDSPAMAQEALQQGERVINCGTAGFRGGAHKGYARIMTDLIRNLRDSVENEPGGEVPAVNILGILPGTDVFFRGELDELRRLLAGIGVTANTFFHDDGLSELKAAKNAGLSLVFSRHGKEPAETLGEMYGVPSLSFSAVPVGLAAVSELLRSVSGALEIAPEIAGSFLESEGDRYNSYLSLLGEAYYEKRLSRPAAIIADEARLNGITRFSSEALGVDIVFSFVTDGDNALPAEESDAQFVFGTALEAGLAKKLDAPLLQIGYPLSPQTVLNRHYCGIDGALRLAEDYERSLS